MGKCPFFKESMWSGNKCQASGDGDGAPIQKRYANYCQMIIIVAHYIKMQRGKEIVVGAI